MALQTQEQVSRGETSEDIYDSNLPLEMEALAHREFFLLNVAGRALAVIHFSRRRF
jgi:hypothetical protein